MLKVNQFFIFSLTAISSQLPENENLQSLIKESVYWMGRILFG